MMSISSFDELIRVARQQPEPQRLLFVFTTAELPGDSTPEQRARFEAGEGGALTPLMCVDKTLEELGTFSDLVEESRQVLQEWAIVFVAALSGKNGRVPQAEGCRSAVEQDGGIYQSGNCRHVYSIRYTWSGSATCSTLNRSLIDCNGLDDDTFPMKRIRTQRNDCLSYTVTESRDTRQTDRHQAVPEKSRNSRLSMPGAGKE